MPYIRDMFVTAKKLFDSSYYGYINSDVLLSYQIFDVIKILRYNAFIGKLGPNVRSVVLDRRQSARGCQVQPDRRQDAARLHERPEGGDQGHAPAAEPALCGGVWGVG